VDEPALDARRGVAAEQRRGLASRPAARREQRGSWACYSLERDKIESLRGALATCR